MNGSAPATSMGRPAAPAKASALLPVLVLAILASACSAPGQWGDRASPVTIGSRAVQPGTPEPTTEASGDAAEALDQSDQSDPVARPDPEADPTIEPVVLGDRAEVVERPCFEAETRCGVVLVPQVEGSPDLVAIPFQEWSEGRVGPPLVVLDWKADDPLHGDHFADRPVVVIGSRDDWRGGPGLACETLESVDQLSIDEVVDAGAQCRTWLEDGGFDMAGAGLRARVAEVGATLHALDHPSISVVAAGAEVDVVAGLAAVLDVVDVVYANPTLPADDVDWESLTVFLDSFEETATQCQRSPGCEPVGSLDDLMAAMAALDADPVPDPWLDDVTIDGTELLGQLLELDEASIYRHLPVVHQAMLDRDAETLRAFLAPLSFDSDGHQRIVGCRLLASTTVGTPAPAEAPTYLVEYVEDLQARQRATCDGLGIIGGPRPTSLPGLVVDTRSQNSSRSSRGEVGPVVTEPTVGWPSSACLAAAISAHLDGVALDPGACQDGMRFVRRDDPITLAGVQVVDDITGQILNVRAPDAWEQTWPGFWRRDADPTDAASLSIDVWEIEDIEFLLEELAWEYDIVDWDQSSIEAGGHLWDIAQGETDPDRLIVASASIDGSGVVIELWAEGGEADRLIRDVLEPALASLSFEGSNAGE